VLKDPNACLYLSIHHPSPEYQEKIRPVRTLLEAWKRKFGIRVEVYQSYGTWTRRYKGFGSAMEPFADGQPRRSWENCVGRHAKQLFEGKLWKCPPLAYLRLQHAKYNLSDKWKRYLKYEPLQPDCTDEELLAFLSREEEPCCNMCSASPQRFELPSYRCH
jgi:hypothetical protein